MNDREVLDTLAAWQGGIHCVGNDGNRHLADARLSVFRSARHFAVFTEFPHFLYGADEFYNWVGCAGDCLVPGAYSKAGFLSLRPLLESLPDAPLWRVDDEYRWLADRRRFALGVNGQRFDFAPGDADYAEADIYFDDFRSGPGSIGTGALLHFLCHHLNHPFFAAEAPLRALMQPEVEPEMELLLQTRAWQHPVRESEGPGAHNAPEDMVCNIPCWRVLSRVIASGDTAEWFAQNTAAFNTDWQSLEAIRAETNIGYGYG